MWSRRVRTVSLPSPAPNVALEATGHSAGFWPGRASVGCGPRLSLGVGHHIGGFMAKFSERIQPQGRVPNLVNFTT
jgi:hypothetical protein